MKGIILEKEKGRIIILTKDGKFIRRKLSTNKEIGEEINIPKIEYKRAISIAAAIILMFSLTFGSYYAYAYPYGYVQIEGDKGVELTYNRQKKVIDVEGLDVEDEKLVNEIKDVLEGKIIEEAVEIAAMNVTEKTNQEEKSTVVIICTLSNEKTNEVIKNELVSETMEDVDIIILNIDKEKYKEAKKNNVNPAEEKLRQRLSQENVSEEEIKKIDSVKELVQKMNEIKNQNKNKNKGKINNKEINSEKQDNNQNDKINNNDQNKKHNTNKHNDIENNNNGNNQGKNNGNIDDDENKGNKNTEAKGKNNGSNKKN